MAAQYDPEKNYFCDKVLKMIYKTSVNEQFENDQSFGIRNQFFEMELEKHLIQKELVKDGVPINRKEVLHEILVFTYEACKDKKYFNQSNKEDVTINLEEAMSFEGPHVSSEDISKISSSLTLTEDKSISWQGPNVSANESDLSDDISGSNSSESSPFQPNIYKYLRLQ